MMTSSVVLNTQMYNIKLRSSILKIKSGAKRKWLSLVLNVDFMTLTILKLIFFPSHSLSSLRTRGHPRKTLLETINLKYFYCILKNF